MLFWSLAALIGAGVLVIYWWASRGLHQADDAAASWEAAWQVLVRQREELDGDVQSGAMTAADHAVALREWSVKAGAIYRERETGVAIKSGRLDGWLSWLLSGIALSSVALYLVWGSPQAMHLAPAEAPVTVASAPAAAHTEAPEEVKAMLASLEAKLEKAPDNVDGWALLARSKAKLGDFAGAASAFEQAVQRVPDNPDLLTDYADVLAMASSRSLQGKPLELVMQALNVAPQHPKALALAATAAMRAGDTDQALRYWQRLRATFADGSDDAREIDAMMAQMRGEAPAAAEPTAVARKALTGVVEIDPALQAKVAAGSTLFVYAREANNRMPLAVLRVPVPASFPFAFGLDDSMAMSPQRKLSDATLVDVEVGISASGEATPQPGDLRGKLAAVQLGSGNLRLRIDTVQP